MLASEINIKFDFSLRVLVFELQWILKLEDAKKQSNL